MGRWVNISMQVVGSHWWKSKHPITPPGSIIQKQNFYSAGVQSTICRKWSMLHLIMYVQLMTRARFGTPDEYKPCTVKICARWGSKPKYLQFYFDFLLQQKGSSPLLTQNGIFDIMLALTC